jgi:hypothetical protein
MTFTYDLSTAIGRTRLRCQDTSSDNAIFSDDEISEFLRFQGSNILLAAADALDVIAANQAYVLKVIENNDLKTDGAQTASALRASAKSLRVQANANRGEDTGICITPNPDDPYLDLR